MASRARYKLVCGRCGAIVRGDKAGALPEHIAGRRLYFYASPKNRRDRCDGTPRKNEMAVGYETRRFIDVPYRGITAAGYLAFHNGRPTNYQNGSFPSTAKSRSWQMGWAKAKLAQEQGKPAL